MQKSLSNALMDYLNLMGRDGLAFGMDVEQVWPTYSAHPQAIQQLLQQSISGRFFTYKKSISSAALEVILQFSGNYLPEQPGLIALESIRFIKKRANIAHVDSYSKGEKRKKVPRLLLSECFFDLQQLSEIGIGFSEDWKTDLVL